MIYVTSDLHGYPLDCFQALLRRAGFGDRDFLFVLGDVIDRNGDGGVEMLRWMMVQPNVQLILGNHEAMLLACDFLFDEITEDSLARLTTDQMAALADWMANGATPTLETLRALNKKDREAVADVLDYLRDAPLYDTVSLENGDFLLTHSGLDNFAPERGLDDYAPDELLWCRPDPEQRYFGQVTTVLGHTPTDAYGAPGRAFHPPTWIDIDTGAAQGRAPMLLRLDDLKEFYIC